MANVFGIPVGIGIIVGTVIFALTGQPIWIVPGMIAGAAIGSYFWRRHEQ